MTDTGKEAAYLKWGDPTEDEPQTYTWNEITAKLGEPRARVRSRARYYKAHHPDEFAATDEPQLLEVDGVTAEEQLPDEDEVYRRAVSDFETIKRINERKLRQHISFDRGPVAPVWMADLHLGDAGVDYERVFREAELVRDTPGMWLFLGGDLLNNFVIGKLRQARDNARMSIPDEWALVRRFLRIVAPKTLLAVSGNHDNWTTLLTGIDYFADVLGSLTSKVIYDSDDVVFTLKVGEWSIPCRARHKWRGLSQWNDTHPIEKAAKFDQDFQIGFGAHTHTSGLARDMNVAGRDGMALLAGSYKRYDTFAKKHGFYKANTSTAVAVVVDEDYHSLTGFNDLATCANYMNCINE